MRGHYSPADDIKISSEHLIAIRKLSKERAEGRYVNDIEGFISAMQSLGSEIEANQDSIADGEQANISGLFNQSGGDMFDEFYHDRELFRTEVT